MRHQLTTTERAAKWWRRNGNRVMMQANLVLAAYTALLVLTGLMIGAI